MDDALAPLVAEYGAMSPRARRGVRRLLDPRERDLIETLAADLADEALSPWLAGRCREAREGAGPLTEAVRRILAPADAALSPAARPRGPSLAGRVGALLGGAR